MAQVTVVGGGVVGLTAALGLARAGHVVRCVRDEPVADTVSAVAGGLWFPYHVEPRDRVLGWGRVALERFTALAGDPDSGVALREGVLVERGPADRWWTAGAADLARGPGRRAAGRCHRRGAGDGAARHDAGVPALARGCAVSRPASRWSRAS